MRGNSGEEKEVREVTLAMRFAERQTFALTLIALTAALALLVTAQPVEAANVMEEDRPMDDAPRAVDDDARQERVVVAPEPPHWNGWGEWYPGQHRSAPRIRVWVDRGEWATYRPGDRLWVYFRVDRPCYVTILDYSPDGVVSTIYPSRWSGSTFVRPGRTYRVPESRRYSLRIAGRGGVETLVACAHEAPWPSGPDGAWIPRHHPHGGRVVVGRPGGSPPPGRRGRVVVGPRNWPVPPAWHDYPERWSCDSVSFYVEDYRDGWWHDDGYWRGDGDVYHGWDDWDDWDDCDDWDHRDRRDNEGRWNDRDRSRRLMIHDSFKMNKCSDDYSREFDIGRTDAVLKIRCIESSKGDPTEIVARVSTRDNRGDDVLFRIDVEGKHGARPDRGRVFRRQWGDTRIEVEITDYKVAPAKSWQLPRIMWIRFDVRVFDR